MTMQKNSKIAAALLTAFVLFLPTALTAQESTLTIVRGDLDFDGPPSENVYEVPVSLSIWGPLFEDGRVCSIGIVFDKVFGIAEKRPPNFS
jgi:hypothetical protein